MSDKDPYTKDEQLVNDALIEAHNKWCEIADRTSQEKQEWVTSFHRLQDLLNHRILRRDYPDTFR